MKSKSGQLYFLKEGIVFGMKRPLLFISADNIIDVGIKKAGRMFDLNVHTSDKEYQFSMIDLIEMNSVSASINNYLQKSSTKSKPIIIIDEEQPNTQVNNSDDSEEGDDDFAPKEDDDPIPEDFDEYNSDEGDGNEDSNSEGSESE